MPAADPYATPPNWLRNDTANLGVVLGLTVLVLASVGAHGFTRADAIYLAVLGLLACRYALSRFDVLPMQHFEVSRWYHTAFVFLLAGGQYVISRIPELQRPL